MTLEHLWKNLLTTQGSPQTLNGGAKGPTKNLEDADSLSSGRNPVPAPRSQAGGDEACIKGMTPTHFLGPPALDSTLLLRPWEPHPVLLGPLRQGSTHQEDVTILRGQAP